MGPHVEDSSIHSSISIVVGLTSAPFDRSMVILVHDTGNGCPLGPMSRRRSAALGFQCCTAKE